MRSCTRLPATRAGGPSLPGQRGMTRPSVTPPQAEPSSWPWTPHTANAETPHALTELWVLHDPTFCTYHLGLVLGTAGVDGNHPRGWRWHFREQDLEESVQDLTPSHHAGPF